MHSRVIGIDFSGARDAHKRIWIAEGEKQPHGVRVVSLRTAGERFGLRDSEELFDALVKWISNQADAVMGVDVPLGLPKELVKGDWHSFTQGFRGRFANADQFRSWCYESAALLGAKEIRRLTDREHQTPFCAYNLRLYRQTYRAFASLIEPLVRENSARFCPMQAMSRPKPTIVEVCPASTLKLRGMYISYKGRSGAHQSARSRIIESLSCKLQDDISEQAKDDSGGDAVDALLCLTAAARVSDSDLKPRHAYDSVESRVFC